MSININISPHTTCTGKSRLYTPSEGFETSENLADKYLNVELYFNFARHI